MKPVTSRFHLPVRNQATGNSPHNLAKNMLNNSDLLSSVHSKSIASL